MSFVNETDLLQNKNHETSCTRENMHAEITNSHRSDDNSKLADVSHENNVQIESKPDRNLQSDSLHTEMLHTFESRCDSARETVERGNEETDEATKYSSEFEYKHTNTCEVVNFGDLDDSIDLEEKPVDALSFVTTDVMLQESKDDKKWEKSENNCDIETVLDDATTDELHVWSTLNGKTFENIECYSNLRKIRLNAQGESWFDNIPDELTVKIFSFLSPQELCRHVAPVCRRWRQFSLDHSLWKCIDFSACPNISTLNLLWITRRAPLLQKLSVSGRTNITHAEVDIFTESCPALQEINFGFCDAFSNEMIQCLWKNCQNLRKINVEGCEKIEHSSIRCLTKCKQLRHMNFSHCHLQDMSLKYLSENVDKIVSINLDGIPFMTDDGIISLVTKHHHHLEELALDGAEISDESISHLAKCKQLKHLSMSFSECLTDQALVCLKDLKALVTLKLRKGCDFSVGGMVTFFQEASLQNLRSLNLSECTHVDDSVCLEMAKSCGKNLRELALSWCWFITDRGLISIVDHCENLKSLDLLGIDKISGECLARVPEEMPRLTFLDLRQCNQILDSLIVDVVRRKPDLKVYNYYGEEFVY